MREEEEEEEEQKKKEKEKEKEKKKKKGSLLMGIDLMFVFTKVSTKSLYKFNIFIFRSH